MIAAGVTLSLYISLPSLAALAAFVTDMGLTGPPVLQMFDAACGSHCPIPFDAPARWNAGLPGVLDRQESRLQLELAVIQRRLARVAQLQDSPQPRTPRSACVRAAGTCITSPMSGWPHRRGKGHPLVRPRHCLPIDTCSQLACLCASGCFWMGCGWPLTAVLHPHPYR